MTLPKDEKKREEYLERMKTINLGRKHSDEINAKKSQKGEEHPNWKGGRSDHWYHKLMANSKIPAICVDCGRTDKLYIHHKDGNHHNNVVDNLEFVCGKCHHKRHPTICTEEKKKILSEKFKGENNPNYGNKWPEERKQALSEKLKNMKRTPWNKGTKGLQVGWLKGTKGIMKPNSGSFQKGMMPWWKKQGFKSVKEAMEKKQA